MPLDPRRTGPRGLRGRAGPPRAPRKRFLIVCEGEKTEPNYFRSFRVAAEVVVEGEGANTTSLVKLAEKHAKASEKADIPFDQVWVVYDKDDFTAAQFNDAAREIERLDAKRKESWHAAWSNSCFELWYLLHFQLLDAQLHRDQLCRTLSEKLRGYRKNDPHLYDRLAPHQDAAVRHAEHLARLHGVSPHGATDPADADPCTLVHHLVLALKNEER